MKLIRFLLIAAITVCTFMTANAQVSVRASIGTQRTHHRTVVVRRPVHHRTVIVRRPVRRHYRRHHVVVRHY